MQQTNDAASKGQTRSERAPGAQQVIVERLLMQVHDWGAMHMLALLMSDPIAVHEMQAQACGTRYFAVAKLLTK
jgi:hypothetical protein